MARANAAVETPGAPSTATGAGLDAGEEIWGGFKPRDLVLIEGDGDDKGWEWEVVERTSTPGVWKVMEVGFPDRFAEHPAGRMTLEIPGEELYDPYAEPEEPPTDEEWIEYLDSLTDVEREELAGPWPVRWLYPWRPGEPKRALNLFAGCGGWCAGLRRVLGYEIDMVCLDMNANAVATSTAAGCTTVRVDVTSLDPEHPALHWTHILIGSPPCTDWTRAGKGLGHLEENLAILLEVIALAGEAAGNVPASGVLGAFTSYKDPAQHAWSELRDELKKMTAPTAGLMAEMIIFALGLLTTGAPLETLAIEQSNVLPHKVRMAIWCEMELAGWLCNRWVEIDAADYGSPSHRRRWFHLASREPVLDTVELEAPLVTFASDALGCAPDLKVITRGNRRTPGGNAFTMGRQIPGVTSKIRGWDVGGDGGRFTLGEMALLVGMPADHPLVGSRTSAAQQLSDIVCPASAAAVLGVLLDVRWRPALRRYLGELYPSAHLAESVVAGTDTGHLPLPRAGADSQQLVAA